MTTVALMFLAALNLLVLAGLGGPAWSTTAAQVVVIAGAVTAASLWLAERVLRIVENRQDRQFRVSAGLPVRRRLWHPGLIALFWGAGLVVGFPLLALVGEWGWRRHFGDRVVTAAEDARLVHMLTRGLTIGVLLYLFLAVTHVVVQVLRRRSDDLRVRQEDQALLTDRDGLAPLPSVWLPAALVGSGRRWRWALREPVDPDEEPPTLRAAPPALRWGYLAALTAACGLSFTLWCLMTAGIITATEQPVAGRVVLAVAWLGVTAVMTNTGGPDLARMLRGIVRAALHRGTPGAAGS